MIRVEDVGEMAYGGAVTVAEWWDNKRIQEGKLASKDVLKKASFYTYLGMGLTATLMSVFGWMRRYTMWQEKVSAGFLYDLPRFAVNMTKTLGASGGGRGADSAAVAEAKRLQSRALAEGRQTDRSYQPEFSKVTAW